jgi:ABC-type sugar transport system ATPase subunit
MEVFSPTVMFASMSGGIQNARKLLSVQDPEDIMISDEKSADAEHYEITAVLPNGPETIVQLTRGETTLITRVGHDSALAEGQTVWVHFKSSALNIYAAETGALISPETVKISEAG